MKVAEKLRARVPHFFGLLKPSSFYYQPMWSSQSAFSEVIDTDRNESLKVIFDKFGSDKASAHDYHVPYSWILNQLPDDGLILEIGIGTKNPNLPSNMGVNGMPGASLRAWRETKKFSVVNGADIDRDCLFREEKISTYFVDQLDVAELVKLREQVKPTKPKRLNLIVDDGLHTYVANKNTFETLFPILDNNGYYVIEDIRPEFLLPLLRLVDSYNPVEVSLWSNPAKRLDNNLIIVKKL